MNSNLDLYFHTARKFEFHQSIDRFGGRAVDVENPFEGAKLELFARFLVDESRTVDGEDLFLGRERNRSTDYGTA